MATIEEFNDVPTADAGGPYSGTVNDTITFDGSGSSDYDNQDGISGNDQTLTYSWTFGDGDGGTGVSPSHTYTTEGPFTVTLVVNDGKIDSSPNTSSVDISAPNTSVSITDISDDSIQRCSCTIPMWIDGSGFGSNVDITIIGGGGPRT